MRRNDRAMHKVERKLEGKRDYRLWQERKLEAPIFGWDMDAYGWVHRLKRQFRMRAASEKEHMQAIVMA